MGSSDLHGLLFLPSSRLQFGTMVRAVPFGGEGKADMKLPPNYPTAASSPINVVLQILGQRRGVAEKL